MNTSPDTLFAALANVTRLRCLLLLLEHGELCVCELTQVVGAAQPNISRHLAHLRESGLVNDRRAGQWIHYQINPNLPDWVHRVLVEAARAAAEVCPVWPGQPMTAHWGVADPAEVEGNDLVKKAAFHRSFAELRNRSSVFVNLPFESLGRLKVQKKLDEIGHISVEDSPESVD